MFRFTSNYFKIILKLNKVTFGKGLKLIGIPVIFRQKGAVLKIGDNCCIKSSFLSNLIGLYQRTIIIARDEGKIFIGNNTGISGATIYAREKIVIGDNTIIGGNAKVLDNDFHPLDPYDRLQDRKDRIGKKEIIIGKNVFIGCNSIILKGTVIGDNSVVGAGSVVSGSYPDNVIIAGNPAKIVKHVEVR